MRRLPRETGERRSRRPLFEIAAVVIVKLLLLGVLSQAFFSSSRQPKIDSDAVSSHLLTPPAMAGRGS